MKCWVRTLILILLSAISLSGVLEACRSAGLHITTPQNMDALRGSCLNIPCSFTTTIPLCTNRNIYGLWRVLNPRRRRMETIHSTLWKPGKGYPMEITGNLFEYDCTTLFSNLLTKHSGTYELRIENPCFKATACNSHFRLTVRDSPPSPTLHVPAELKEAESVTITCSAPAPCPHSPPTLTWNLQGNAQNKVERNPDGTFTAKIRWNVTLSEDHDGHNVSCSATYPTDGGGTKTAGTNTTLSVSYAPKNTSASVSPSAPVSAGSLVTLNCSSRAKPTARFTWFRRRLGGGDSAEYERDVYAFNLTEGGVYYCVAENNLGNQSSVEMRLTLIADGSDQWWLVFGGIFGIITLICLVFCICALVLFKSAHPAPQNTESQAGAGALEEEIHYAEIDFSKHGPSASARGGGQQQQTTMYSEVKVSTEANGSTLSPDDGEDAHAEVKKTN